MSALVGALGSVIGYLGSEVAEETLFERLMWPQRYYYEFSFSVFVKQSLFMTMGGPLHGAALATLDVLRDNGLYLGARRGHMLGTAFLPDSHIKNFHRTNDLTSTTPKESRNGFWIEVLRNIKDGPKSTSGTDLVKADTESNDQDNPPYRAMQLVHHLTLKHIVPGDHPGPKVRCISEQHSRLTTVANVVSSELVAIAAAVIAGTVLRSLWMAPYMCLPLILKLLSVLVNVRRQVLKSEEELRKDGSLTDVELFEVEDPNHGFVIIEGPSPVVQQFFRHYGHPVRDRRTNLVGDRFREVVSIMLIYIFVLYFPAGLIASLWMSTKLQYLWLWYQVYAILAMHVVRILGWEGCGRTEERVADLLIANREVWLQSTINPTQTQKKETNSSPDKSRRVVNTVGATLITSGPFQRTEDGRAEVEKIVSRHRESQSALFARAGQSTPTSSTFAASVHEEKPVAFAAPDGLDVIHEPKSPKGNEIRLRKLGPPEPKPIVKPTATSAHPADTEPTLPGNSNDAPRAKLLRDKTKHTQSTPPEDQNVMKKPRPPTEEKPKPSAAQAMYIESKDQSTQESKKAPSVG